MNDKPAKIEMVTLEQLWAELKIDPRVARERLRLLFATRRKMPTREGAQARAHLGMAKALACSKGSESRFDKLKWNSASRSRSPAIVLRSH